MMQSNTSFSLTKKKILAHMLKHTYTMVVNILDMKKNSISSDFLQGLNIYKL